MNFLEKLEMQVTDKRIPNPMPVTVKHYDDVPSSFGERREYRIEVNWGFKVYCEPKHKHEMLQNAYKQLKMDIYDGFLRDILRLERAVYGGNQDEIFSACRDLKVRVGL